MRCEVLECQRGGQVTACESGLKPSSQIVFGVVQTVHEHTEMEMLSRRAAESVSHTAQR